ncbi:hypothetical protein ACIRYZ_10845 [Kitasatospora sp. NPDC101155]|uniref:hypothetical protein n=1 Tax=Kitasatospora sp. NPDC101155 TaxID=3364097 RepID=UPI0038064D06
MPATLSDDGLSLTCVFSDRTRTHQVLDPSGNPELARQLLVGLAELVHPNGRLNSARTIGSYMTALRSLLTSLQRLGFQGRAEDLTRARLAEVWMGAGQSRTAHRNEGLARTVLRSLDDLHGALRPDVRDLVDGRMFRPNLRVDRRTLPPYTESEWQRLITVCRSLIKPAFAAYRQARAQAERGSDPAEAGWTEESIQWMLLNRGPESAEVLATTVRRGRRASTRPDAVPAELYPQGQAEALEGLYPSLDVLKAYQVLLGAYTGIVPDGLIDLGLDGIDWAGDATVLLTYVKGRTATESLTLSTKATRLLEQWLEHSSVTRAHAPETLRDELWVRYCLQGGTQWSAGRAHRSVTPRWAGRHGIVDDAGAPLQLHEHRFRTTFESLRDRRGWRGSPRATIDPNHSPQVEGDHYLQVATPAQKAAVDSIIEEAQMDMLRRAQPPMILATEDAAKFAESYPDVVERLGLSDAAIAELLAGERDVFTAACADQLSGLHGPKGKPCPARPWVCLLCPLSMYAPRHLPNLLRLKAFFARQWKQMPTAQFMAVFGPYATRLDRVLTEDNFPAGALARAAGEVTDTDTDLPLRAEEMTA